MEKHSKALLFINVHSLRSHHDQLCCQLETLKTNSAVIAVCETWLIDNDPIDMYFITGYQPLIVKNRNDKRGGGVGFFVREDCKIISNFFFEENLEHLLLSIESGKKRINFCVLHRPPSEKIQNFLETFESLLFKINAMKEETIICGDFNIDISDAYHQQYQNLINSFNYEMQNAEPTRVTKFTSKCTDQIFDDKCPITKKKIFKNSWMTNRLKNLISKRDRAHDTLISHPNSKNEVRFKQLRNLVTNEVGNARKQHYDQKLTLSGSPALKFKVFKKFLGQRKKSVKDIDVEEFNHFFTNVGKKVSNTNFHNVDSEPGLPCHDKTFFLFPVNTIEIFNIISSLENKSTAGHDGISNNFLKLVASVVSYHVAKLINRSIQEGVFPVCLKTAKVIPIHKIGSFENPSNYRPISLLSSLSKVFEKVLNTRMVEFLEKHQLLSNEQFGFRPKRSCTHAIASVTELMRNIIDSQKMGFAFFIDFQKAFD